MENEKEQAADGVNHVQDEDDFGVGMTINELIADLENIRKQYGNINVGVLGNKPGRWYGMLDGPTVRTVDRNPYKSCYVVGSKETIVTFD
jgi:hypothetical protein